MKKILSLYLVLASFAAAAQNSLTGKITDQTTHEPLTGVTIYLPDLRQGASTDATGTYEIRNLPKGKFLVQIRFIGYTSVTKPLNINGITTFDAVLAESVTELGAVVITGVSASTERHQNPVPTTVVGHDDMQQRASTNVVDAIARTPGIAQISTGAAISKPVIRGLSANRVVTLNNGMRQEGQQWGDEHGIEIDENAIDRAEIVKGPGSIMYGSDAMAGVINFLAADPVEEGKITAAYSGNYQTNNHLFSNSVANAGNINGFNWQARASQKSAGNYRNQYDGRVFNSGFNEKNASGYVGLNKNWGYSHLVFSTFNQQLGLVEGDRDEAGNFLKPVNNHGEAEEASVTNSDLSGYQLSIPKQEVNHYRVAAQNNFILGNSRLSANLDWQQNLRKEFGNILVPEEKSLFFDLQTVSYDVKYFLPELAGWNLTFGSGGMHQTSQNKGVEFLIPEYAMTDLGVFGFVTRNFQTLHVSGGLRYDHRFLSSETLLLNAEDKPTTDPDESVSTKFSGFNRSFSNVTGSAGVAYDFSEKLTGKLNLARGFRAPNIAELASNGRHEGTIRYEIGNTDLKPETSFQLDAGLDLHSEHVNLEISAFTNTIQQYIFAQKLLSKSGGDSISDVNEPTPSFKFVQGNARLYGGEISIDLHPHPLDWLHFENSFSYVRGIQLNQPDSLRNLPFIPAARLQSELRVNFSPKSKMVKNWFARLELEHNFAQNHFFSAFGTETATPAYTLVNLGAGIDVPNGKNATLFTFYITAANIFDVAYQNHLSRLKYAAVNEATGRMGVFNMGRNISFKIAVPATFSVKKQ